ncbi:MAG: sulfite exporter TauE/SafE family protein [Pseudomonadota bacterium]
MRNQQPGVVMSLSILFFLLLTGVLAGVLSGLLGLGGGIVVVPILAYLFQHGLKEIVPNALVMHMAVATSLVSILLVSLTSAYAHQRKGSVRWDIWQRWVVGLMVGSLIGSYCMTILNVVWLRNLFAVFLLLVVLKLLIEHRLPKIQLPMKTPFLFCIGLLMGAFSGTLGVGGGILMMPVLLGLGCTMSESAATSSASMVPLSLIATVSFIVLGDAQQIHVAWSIGYIFWPAVVIIGFSGLIFAPLGAKLSYLLPAIWTKRILALLLCIVSLQMLR